MKFCSEFNNVLTFFPERISSCCVLEKEGPVYCINENNDIKNFNFEDLKNNKQQIYEAILNEDFEHIPCKNCFYLKDKTEDDVFTYKYNLLYLNNWTHCNCGCFYCDRMEYSKGKITTQKEKSQYYDMLPIIKELYKRDLLDVENLRIVFHGGDLTVLKEFEDLTKTFIKYGFEQIDFSSNNIIYQPLISKLLLQERATLTMSLDCGTRETYKLIKRVDKFNDVVKNLKKYVQSNVYRLKINVKYIMLKNINDNEQEIRAFFNLMKDIGIKIVELHLEHKYATELYNNKNQIPAHYKDLINLFFELCRENNITSNPPDEFMNFLITNA